jgi:hypothetical protein
MTTTSAPSTPLAHPHRAVSLTVSLVTVALFIAALTVTLTLSLTSRHDSPQTGNSGQTSVSGSDNCNRHKPGSYC